MQMKGRGSGGGGAAAPSLGQTGPGNRQGAFFTRAPAVFPSASFYFYHRSEWQPFIARGGGGGVERGLKLHSGVESRNCRHPLCDPPLQPQEGIPKGGDPCMCMHACVNVCVCTHACMHAHPCTRARLIMTGIFIKSFHPPRPAAAAVLLAAKLAASAPRIATRWKAGRRRSSPLFCRADPAGLPSPSTSHPPPRRGSPPKWVSIY